MRTVLKSKAEPAPRVAHFSTAGLILVKRNFSLATSGRYAQSAPKLNPRTMSTYNIINSRAQLIISSLRNRAGVMFQFVLVQSQRGRRDFANYENGGPALKRNSNGRNPSYAFIRSPRRVKVKREAFVCGTSRFFQESLRGSRT